MPRVQPIWKLTGVGSVGSQSLLGIARLEALRHHPALAAHIAVWPFETGFATDLSKPITVVEIYPSMFPVTEADGLPRDRAQVEVASTSFAELDRDELLAPFLSAPASLTPEQRALALAEEGWIAGAGQQALLANLRSARMTYLRDPDAIYEASFATIRAEADLAHLPPALRARRHPHDPCLRNGRPGGRHRRRSRGR